MLSTCIIKIDFGLPPEGIFGKRKMTGESSHSTSGADICRRMGGKKTNFSLLLFVILALSFQGTALPLLLVALEDGAVIPKNSQEKQNI